MSSSSLERALPEATLSARFSQRVASGSDDQEQQITSLSLSYDRQITALTRFSTSITYSETDDTAASNTSSFGTLGVSLQRSLSAGYTAGPRAAAPRQRRQQRRARARQPPVHHPAPRPVVAALGPGPSRQSDAIHLQPCGWSATHRA